MAGRHMRAYQAQSTPKPSPSAWAVGELCEMVETLVDHLDCACCEGFRENNAPQRQRARALLAKVRG